MILKCKHCGSDKSKKNGIVGGKQRYECKNCHKTYREGDLREKYTNEKRMRVRTCLHVLPNLLNNTIE